ncbi:MAG: hypothetical protein D6812_10720 [Deltaproteobacteria bacterium]|nr:MAG: hypothetical protein D6812_10720 [Deltaproteobacteria bacterium]
MDPFNRFGITLAIPPNETKCFFLSPNETSRCVVYLRVIASESNIPPDLQKEVVKETIAHEIGHAIHICHHRGTDSQGNQQTDCDVCCHNGCTTTPCTTSCPLGVGNVDGATDLEGCDDIPQPGSVMRTRMWWHPGCPYPVNVVFKHYSDKDKAQIRLHVNH